MSSTRQRRYQPARKYLIEQRWSIPAAARELNRLAPADLGEVTTGHLHYALVGFAAPSPALRATLPLLLGRPVEELFEPDLLAREWSGHRSNTMTAGLDA